MKIPTQPSSHSSASQNGDSVSPDGSPANGQGLVNGGLHSNGSENESESISERHEEAMFSAIDTFCSSSEQTYEQFMQCFTQLRPEDVLPQRAGPVGASLQTLIGMRPGFHPAPATSNTGDRQVGNTSTAASVRPTVHSTQSEATSSKTVEPETQTLGDDALEEELLPEGTRVPEVLLRQADGSSQHLVKFDNFVETEEGSDAEHEEDDIDTEPCDTQPYVASFGSAQSDTTTTQSRTGGSPGGSQDPEEQEEMTYDPSQDLPNPGEVIDSDTENHVEAPPVNVRCMTYSAKMSDGNHGNQPSEEHQCNCGDSDQSSLIGGPSQVSSPEACSCDDQVEAFSLDKDFDYDNVTLTPKYTAQEMKLLRTLMNTGPPTIQEPAEDL